MAAAKATVTNAVTKRVHGLLKSKATLAFDTGDYAQATGVSLPLKDICPGAQEAIIVDIAEKALGGVLYRHKYDYTNETVHIWQLSLNVTAGTAGNAVTLNSDHLEATGGGTVLIDEDEYADATALPADYTGIEVRVLGNTTY